jgi:Na+-driven multidrug efflux pump
MPAKSDGSPLIKSKN